MVSRLAFLQAVVTKESCLQVSEYCESFWTRSGYSCVDRMFELTVLKVSTYVSLSLCHCDH